MIDDNDDCFLQRWYSPKKERVVSSVSPSLGHLQNTWVLKLVHQAVYCLHVFLLEVDGRRVPEILKRTEIHNLFQLPTSKISQFANYFVAYCTLISWLYLSTFVPPVHLKRLAHIFHLHEFLGFRRKDTWPHRGSCAGWHWWRGLWRCCGWRTSPMLVRTTPVLMRWVFGTSKTSSVQRHPFTRLPPNSFKRLSIRDSYLACTLVFFRICKFLKLGGVKAWYKITPHKEDVSILWKILADMPP